MIKVLHIVGKMDRGGQETFIMNIYRKIDHSKVQFDFIVHSNDHCDYEDEILKLGGTIYRVAPLSKNPVKHFLMIKTIVDENHYTIVHRHTSNAITGIDLLASKLAGARMRISHSHNTQDKKEKINFLFRGMNNMIATKNLACSTNAGKWLYGDKSSFTVINNGIDVKVFTYDEKVRIEKRKEFQIEDKVVIGHIGRFDLQKNHEFLIDIFKEVFNKNKNTVLMLVGTGKLHSAIKEKVNRLGLSQNVIFMGMREDIPDLLQSMDVFLFPSIFEGLPVTLIEAQAAGLHCVVSDVISKEVCITDLIHYVLINETPEIWAKIVLEQMNDKRKNKCKEIQDSGYDIESTMKKMQELYLMA